MVQVVRLVVAGGLMHRAAVDALAAPTTHASFRAANTVLQPVQCALRPTAYLVTLKMLCSCSAACF